MCNPLCSGYLLGHFPGFVACRSRSFFRGVLHFLSVHLRSLSSSSTGSRPIAFQPVILLRCIFSCVLPLFRFFCAVSCSSLDWISSNAFSACHILPALHFLSCKLPLFRFLLRSLLFQPRLDLVQLPFKPRHLLRCIFSVASFLFRFLLRLLFQPQLISSNAFQASSSSLRCILSCFRSSASFCDLCSSLDWISSNCFSSLVTSSLCCAFSAFRASVSCARSFLISKLFSGQAHSAHPQPFCAAATHMTVPRRPKSRGCGIPAPAAVQRPVVPRAVPRDARETEPPTCPAHRTSLFSAFLIVEAIPPSLTSSAHVHATKAILHRALLSISYVPSASVLLLAQLVDQQRVALVTVDLLGHGANAFSNFVTTTRFPVLNLFGERHFLLVLSSLHRQQRLAPAPG